MEIRLKDINKNRSYMMGVATILVILVHLWITNEPYWCGCIRRFCQNGVDIFLFLSGLGCYYSISNHTAGEFYCRRAKRILPSFLIVFFAYAIIQCVCWKEGIVNYINENFIHSFFCFGTVSNWFVPAIITLYAFTPLFYKILQHEKIYILTFIGIILATSQFYFFSKNDIFNTINELFLTRIPIYMLGLYFGKYIKDHEEDTFKITAEFIFFTIACLILFFLNSFFNTTNVMGITHYISILLVPMLVILMAAFFNNHDIQPLSEIGKISFECYLLNEKIAFLMVALMPITDYYIVNLFGFVITIILAYILRRVRYESKI